MIKHWKKLKKTVIWDGGSSYLIIDTKACGTHTIQSHEAQLLVSNKPGPPNLKLPSIPQLPAASHQWPPLSAVSFHEPSRFSVFPRKSFDLLPRHSKISAVLALFMFNV